MTSTPVQSDSPFSPIIDDLEHATNDWIQFQQRTISSLQKGLEIPDLDRIASPYKRTLATKMDDAEAILRNPANRDHPLYEEALEKFNTGLSIYNATVTGLLLQRAIVLNKTDKYAHAMYEAHMMVAKALERTAGKR